MKRMLLAIALLLLATGTEAATPPPNFGVVVENAIYRGGQPRNKQFDYIHELGVKTILKLNHHDLDDERAATTRLGMKLVNIPLDPATIGGPETCADIALALAVLNDRANWPVYVHCTKGRDRTGYVVGAFREIVQHWTWNEVDAELSQYGHTTPLRHTYPLIERELRAGAPTCSSEIDQLEGAASAH
jgi:tyrosine-protein phosphatase SIW14